MAANTVLVTDDDDHVRRAVARLLRHHGYHVVCAASGAQALELASAALPALVLLDVMMPEMDGFAVARALREQHGHACPPIAIMSAGPPCDAQSRAVGALGFLRKPFSSDALLSLTERAVHGHDPRRATASTEAAHPF